MAEAVSRRTDRATSTRPLRERTGHPPGTLSGGGNQRLVLYSLRSLALRKLSPNLEYTSTKNGLNSLMSSSSALSAKKRSYDSIAGKSNPLSFKTPA